MTDHAPPSPEPDGAPRIASLDILRGLAILGILFMNINDMGASLIASFGDVRHIGWTPADRVAWWLREVLANGTARGLLQLLFGAGMVILTDRAAVRLGEGGVVRGYLRRQIVLLVLGLIHLFVLLWPGDILHTYALAAMIAVLFRGLPPRLLLVCGLSLAMWEVATGAYSLQAHADRQAVVAVARAHRAAGDRLTPADRRTLAAAAKTERDQRAAAAREQRSIAEEDTTRTGDARSWAASAWEATLRLQRKGFELLFVWEAAAAMLVGAALYRWGIIQGARSRRFYAAMAIGGYAVGIPLRVVSAIQATRFDGGANIDWATYEIARLAMTVGHLGAVHLLLQISIGARMLRPFAAAGRTALTIYVLQTLVCLWLLYPPFGLALYGRQGWAALMLTALAIDAGLLLLACWWTRRFTIAPVEWAWRSLAEGRRLPFARTTR